MKWSTIYWDNGIIKICNKCGSHKKATTKQFNKNRAGRFGLKSFCIICSRKSALEYIRSPDVIKSRKDYSEEYIASGRNARANRLWRKRNPNSAKKSAQKWKSKNKQYIRKQQQEYRDANREKIREKQRRADTKLQKKPTHVLKKRLKARLRTMIKGVCTAESERIFGFTYEELKSHIESRFDKYMSWDALCSGEIHIDHKRPVSSFNIKSIHDPDFKKCWSLKNLQPLWAKDNYLKGADWDG